MMMMTMTGATTRIICPVSVFFSSKGVFLDMYADDVSMYTQHVDKSQALTLLQEGADRVVSWSKANEMILNAKKS